MDDTARTAWLHQFLNDLLWEVGQIGQAALNVAIVVITGLLLYAHGTAQPGALQSRALPQPMVCLQDCIVTEVLKPPEAKPPQT